MKRQQNNYIVINGKTYDANSGMTVHSKLAPEGQLNKRMFNDIARPQKAQTAPVAKPASPEKTTRADIVARRIHHKPQKAKTLYREAVQAPQPAPRIEKPQRKIQQVAREQRAADVTQVAEVRKFKQNQPEQPRPVKTMDTMQPSLTLSQIQAKHTPAPSQPATPVSAPVQNKEQLIAEMLSSAPAQQPSTPNTQEQDTQSKPHTYEPEQKVNKFFSRQPRLISAIAGALCVLLLVGYITYLNMPAISLRVAASRAGFTATMPATKPSGYSLQGPVAYSPGQVTINFVSNINDQTFSLTEKETNWDAQALLDNHVAKQTDNYLTYQEKGLVVYMYDSKASWVNGGVWYNIDGTANLSSEQILDVATSM